jgi:hypothetical protein
MGPRSAVVIVPLPRSARSPISQLMALFSKTCDIEEERTKFPESCIHDSCSPPTKWHNAGFPSDSWFWVTLIQNENQSLYIYTGMRTHKRYVAAMLSHHKHGTSLVLTPSYSKIVLTHMTFLWNWPKISILLLYVACFLTVYEMRIGSKKYNNPFCGPFIIYASCLICIESHLSKQI